MLHSNVKLRVLAAAKRWESRAGVLLMGFENVGNHLHLVVLARKRGELQKFLRGFAGQVAMLMTGAKKGRKGKFWTELAWSRVVNWGRDLLSLGDYLSRNLLESLGVDRVKMIPLGRLRRRLGPGPAGASGFS
jgi:REP element-mobilizing transposase RayT